MEKIESICVMRELICAMSELESQLQDRWGISSTEAMAMCCIGQDTVIASLISESIGIKPSHTSKVLSSMEKKELVSRSVGTVDRRQMQFSLTEKGRQLLQSIKTEKIDIPPFLRPLFTDC